MNNDVSTKESSGVKSGVLKILGYVLCFIIGLAIVLGVKSCVKKSGMPEDFKEAEKILKREGFSQIRYLNDEEKIEEMLQELDIDAVGINEVLVAYDEDSEDCFFVLYCEDVSSAEEVLDEFIWILAKDDYLYYRDYGTESTYRTVYFGHKDLISEMIE